MIRKISLVVLHLSFVLILAGAIVSAYTRTSGTMRLHRGETADIFVSDDMLTHPLPAALQLDSVAVFAGEGYNSSPEIFLKDQKGHCYAVAVNSPAEAGDYLLYQISVDEEEAVLGVTFDPWGRSLCFLGFILFSAVALALLAVDGKLMRRLLVALAAVVLLLGFLMDRGLLFNGLTPLLRSAWLPLHVSLMAVAYTLFIMLTVMSAVVLSGTGRESLSVWVERLLLPGVLFLGLGIVAGSVWADASWGSYWNWDPKETWALVTFLVYALPLHRRLRFLQGRRVRALYFLSAFLAVVMTWFGVNFLDSRHAY